MLFIHMLSPIAAAAAAAAAAESDEDETYPDPEVQDKEKEDKVPENPNVLEVEGNYDTVADINSNVELSCRYTSQHQDEVQWKKQDGVTIES